MELVACIVGRPIGRGDEIRVKDVGQIAPDEFGVINPIARDLMNGIVALWSEVVDMEIIEPEVETSNVYVMGSWIASDDPMFHVRFEVAWDDRISHINLCYPAPSMAAGVAQLQTQGEPA
jgi:flagellar motor switch protein FliM